MIAAEVLDYYVFRLVLGEEPPSDTNRCGPGGSEAGVRLRVDVGLVERGEQAESFVWQTWLKPTHRLALWFSQLPEVRPRGVGGRSVSPYTRLRT